MANAVVGRHGRIDGLVHTVGGFAMGRIVDGDVATYDRMFDLNVRTLFNVLRAVAPAMLARGDGFICGISSEPGWTGRSPGTALYGAAKAAATSLLRTLEAEARGTQVGVCIVYPMGAIDTPANRNDMPDADPRTFIDPGEIAATILHAATRGPRGRLSEVPIHPPRPHDAMMPRQTFVRDRDPPRHRRPSAQQPQPTPTPATPAGVAVPSTPAPASPTVAPGRRRPSRPRRTT